MTSRTKLRQLLTQSKPTIECVSTNANTYANETWPQLRGHIREWADFKFGTLDSLYGEILDMELEYPEAERVAKENLENLTISTVRDIKQVIAWNASMLGPALELGQSQLQLKKLRIVNEHKNPRITAAHSQTTLHHLIELTDAPQRTLLVGLGATSEKFRGGTHLSRTNQMNKASREENLLRQLAHACNLANSRYGYIQTNAELVACRFSRTGTVWEAEIMPIPMALSGDEIMTTTLAIWWMAMLALPDKGDSDIRPMEDMAPLDAKVASKDREDNHDSQASAAGPSGNPGRVNGPSAPSGRHMGVLDNDGGIASLPSFPSFTNTGMADNSIGDPYDPNSGFATGIQLSDYLNVDLEGEMDLAELQGLNSK